MEYLECIRDPKNHKITDSYLNKRIPELIEENERLRMSKTFYKPGKKRRKIYEEKILPFIKNN